MSSTELKMSEGRSFVANNPLHGKNSPANIKFTELAAKDILVACIVFAITGSSAAYFVRPTLRYIVSSTFLGPFLGLDEASSLVAGPWAFRVMYFTVMWPMYTVLLLAVGTLAGMGTFFRPFVLKMWSRILPRAAAAKLGQLLS
ncbi:hypothetical protein SARC_09910 [Sphaeroforma arctica JP610]|uniref:DUF6787 domain-containing protein n=1 Tax=Sphaeroforma arctica JP610 TaxID=667725 RepID=A0A0L0FLH7_9EUKA|nr:hypothetical protein SARC_09910 [Sphaeroforma arctica JP610]KNC77629.1 hypothetical protein SARC_09910 [Sphaeroforma arctica JP610]|eukprot:XP_014151531.1 hypothetical protein SARC_09910 [Sphaeroforma arctica JP610]